MIIILSSLYPENNIRNVDISQYNTNNTNNPEQLDISLRANEQLGFIISKNPASGMIKRKIHSGEVSAYYYKNHPGYYIMYFHDYTGSSYSEEDNYLNPRQYIAPQSVINIICELFNIQNKKLDIDADMKYINSLYVMMVKINHVKTVKQLSNKFPDFITEFIPSELPNHFSVNIKTFRNIHYLFNFVLTLFMTIASLDESNKYQILNSSAQKLVSCINNINAPYFVRYMMSSRILEKKDFNSLKKDLERSDNHSITLNYGTTAEHRRKYIKSLLSFQNDIVDIGCGDGFYAIPFCKNLNNGLSYYAFDIDINETRKLAKKIFKNKLNNINLYELQSEFYENLATLNNPDIIITEVIEHMEEQQSIEFLIDIFNIVKDKVHIIIITTPNYEFNINYCLDGKFRHLDHKWEMTRAQFRSFINDIVYKSCYKCNIKFVDIGDMVDGISCTQGCIIDFQ